MLAKEDALHCPESGVVNTQTPSSQAHLRDVRREVKTDSAGHGDVVLFTALLMRQWRMRLLCVGAGSRVCNAMLVALLPSAAVVGFVLFSFAKSCSVYCGLCVRVCAHIDKDGDVVRSWVFRLITVECTVKHASPF